MADKTLAMKLLEGKRMAYDTAVYPNSIRDAEAVAAHLGADPAHVFKTLVVGPPAKTGPQRRPLLVLVPANRSLDLKALASVVGVKKVKLVSHSEAESLTGLQVGGISPLALLNKGFRIYVDDSARDLETIYVSAGQRGIQIKVAVTDLVAVTRARYAAVAGVAVGA